MNWSNLFWFEGIIVFLLIIWLVIGGDTPNKVAVVCYVCKGSGEAPDREFECEECEGGGVLICETYASRKVLQKVWGKDFLWYI